MKTAEGYIYIHTYTYLLILLSLRERSLFWPFLCRLFAADYKQAKGGATARLTINGNSKSSIRAFHVFFFSTSLHTMDGKPMSQFKLARLQAQQEKEAAARNARQTQTPSAALPAEVAHPKEAAPKEAAAAPAATTESSHKVPVQPLAAQKRQFPHSTSSTEADHGAHQQPTGGHRRQSEETVEDKVERYMGVLKCFL